MRHEEGQEAVANEGRVLDYLHEREGTVKGYGIGFDDLLVLWDGDERPSLEELEDLWPASAAIPGP
jgi:hypothetical protein